MLALSGVRRCAAAIVLVVVVMASEFKAQAMDIPRLQILPSQSVQTKPVGKSLLLTCRPDVADTNLITDLQWKDQNNRTILPSARHLTRSSGGGGQRPPMYTEMLPGEMSLALYIPTLTEDMAGDYYCTASYANTERLEVKVRIDTIVAITWIDAPENQYPIEGTDYKIRCEVTASPSPTVDWLRDGEQVLTSGRRVVETRGLLIRDVREEDDGLYTCRAAVISTGELAERNIRVEVHKPPVIEPMDTTLEVVEGESASIQCRATGKPRPTFEWIKQETQQDLSTADRFAVDQHTGVLRLNRVEQSDRGLYACFARNAAGVSPPSNVNVEVVVKPKVHTLVNVTATFEKTTKLVCIASGRPAPAVTFKRWGADVEMLPGPQPGDDRVVLEQEVNSELGETTGTLTITNVVRSDDGLYECIARNKGDTYYKTGHITVEFPPTFEASKNQPPVFSWDQRTANLSCLAESIPNATIEWRLNDRPIIEDRFYRIEGSGPQSNLIVKPLDRRMYTKYKCVATNRLGKAEHLVDLREAHPPQAISQAKINTITATSVSFDIMGPGDNDGMPILGYVCQYKPERELDWRGARNATWSAESSYTIDGLVPETIYHFRFAATNAVGPGPYSNNIAQATPRRSPPEEPKLLVGVSNEVDGGIVTSPYADHYELRWKIPADNGEPIDYYQLRYCPVQRQNGAWTELDSLCNARELRAFETTAHELNDLLADSHYKVELRAHNALGDSPPAQILLKTARGMDSVVRSEGPSLSSSAIVGIAVGAVVLLLLLVDLSCYCVARAGLLAAACHARTKPTDDEEAAKLGRDEQEPLQNGNVKRNTSVEFDGKKARAKTGEIVGKNSAV